MEVYCVFIKFSVICRDARIKHLMDLLLLTAKLNQQFPVPARLYGFKPRCYKHFSACFSWFVEGNYAIAFSLLLRNKIVHSMMIHGESWGMAPLILKLCTNWRWVRLHRRSGGVGEEKNHWPVPGIEPRCHIQQTAMNSVFLKNQLYTLKYN